MTDAASAGLARHWASRGLAAELAPPVAAPAAPRPEPPDDPSDPHLHTLRMVRHQRSGDVRVLIQGAPVEEILRDAREGGQHELRAPDGAVVRVLSCQDLALLDLAKRIVAVAEKRFEKAEARDAAAERTRPKAERNAESLLVRYISEDAFAGPRLLMETLDHELQQALPHLTAKDVETAARLSRQVVTRTLMAIDEVDRTLEREHARAEFCAAHLMATMRKAVKAARR